MTEFLLFRVYGMMASWGDIAVGEFRPTFDRPSKSAIIGMVAAAIGIKREEEERLRELATSYLMAIQVDAPGVLLRDYHTAQVPPSGKGRNKQHFPTRKAELSVPKDEINTILSTRDYRCDAIHTICLWSKTDSPPYLLSILKQHLEQPFFQLYLGRKSCPLALPLKPQVVLADTISQAFSSVQFLDGPFMNTLYPNRDIGVYWEGDVEAGFEMVHTVQRRDDPLSKNRWQFGNRVEHYAMIPSPHGG